MARKALIEKEKHRAKMVANKAASRKALKEKIMDRSLPIEERFALQLKLSEKPRSSSRVRLRNRCLLTGRSRGVYRRFQLSRIMIRDLGSVGLIPGLKKASW